MIYVPVRNLGDFRHVRLSLESRITCSIRKFPNAVEYLGYEGDRV